MNESKLRKLEDTITQSCLRFANTIIDQIKDFHKPDKTPWIENPGYCPVPGEQLVDVKLRCGHNKESGRNARCFDWSLDDSRYDITHYRLTPGAPVVKAKPPLDSDEPLTKEWCNEHLGSTELSNGFYYYSLNGRIHIRIVDRKAYLFIGFLRGHTPTFLCNVKTPNDLRRWCKASGIEHSICEQSE